MSKTTRFNFTSGWIFAVRLATSHDRHSEFGRLSSRFMLLMIFFLIIFLPIPIGSRLGIDFLSLPGPHSEIVTDILAICSGLAPVVYIVFIILKARQIHKAYYKSNGKLCPQCWYDLSAHSSSTCECGYEFTEDSLLRSWRAFSGSSAHE